MARNLTATCKKIRRIGKNIDGLKRRLEGKCKLTTPPGQHGSRKGRRTSDYGTMLQAKQMLKIMYGVLERQFKRYYFEASRRKGATGEVLLELLESRLDNVVYRMGYGSTRAEARQLVRHKSIVVAPQGKEELKRVVNIPSYSVKPGDIVEVRESSKQQARVNDSLTIMENSGFAEWLSVDVSKKAGIFNRLPARLELSSDINEQLVVELYSK